MNWNKTILIVGLIIGGLASLYLSNNELASAIFGGLVGYLAKDNVVYKKKEELEDLSDEEDFGTA